jgi:hypothetical protein
VKVHVLPRQWDFLNSQAREVLFSGAFGAGKSRAVCLKIAMRASRPGAREGLCRKTLVGLKATTLRTLLEPEGRLPPVLPPSHVEHNRNDRRIKIRGGGEIVYFDLETPEKIGSYRFSGIGVDEATELREADWTFLRGRMNIEVPGIRQQLYGACNPSGPSHFLARRFGLAGGAPAADGCEAVVTRSSENVFLSRDYLADLERFVGVARARFVDGRWAASDRLVYDAFRADAFVAPAPPGLGRFVVSIDPGYRNPTAILLVGADGDGRLHVVSSLYRPGLLHSEIVAEARALAEAGAGASGVEAWLYDPSEAALGAEMRAAGLPAVEAENEVLAGIARVRERLVVAGDGRPRLTVGPGNEAVVREFETYETREGTDAPVKVNDHAMDALRYAVAWFAASEARAPAWEGAAGGGWEADRVFGDSGAERGAAARALALGE